jgi:hypothetical protein
METIIVALAATPRTSRGVGIKVWQVGHRVGVRLTRRAQWGHNFFGFCLTIELKSPGATKNNRAPRSIYRASDLLDRSLHSLAAPIAMGKSNGRGNLSHFRRTGKPSFPKHNGRFRVNELARFGRKLVISSQILLTCANLLSGMSITGRPAESGNPTSDN